MNALVQTRFRAPFVMSVASLLCSAAIPAFAEEAPAVAAAEEPAAEIIVTGQREAERRAIDRKRAADAIQDSVSSNDVGKLPDQNVAEAVRRIPGVSIANDQGEGRYVIIRGVDPNLANVTINGQTAAAPEPEGRQVKLDDIPSSLIGSVDVVKSLTPDRDANAIAGQVDINTLTAFDRPGTFVYARGAAGLNDLSGKTPWEADATFGTRFGASRDFGIVVSGNASRRPIESENVQGSEAWTNGRPDDFRLRDYNLVRQRYGAVANLDWRPSDDMQLFLRTLYSAFKDHETRDQSRIALGGYGAASGDTIAFTGGRGYRYVRERNEEDSTFTVQGGGKFGLGGAKLTVEGTYSKAIKKDPLRSEFQFATSKNAISGTVDLSDFLFQVTPSATAYDPSAYKAAKVSYEHRRAQEELIQARADLELPVGWGDDSKIKLGAKYLGRDKTNDRAYAAYTLSGFNLSVGGVDDGTYIYNGRYKLGPRVDYATVRAYIGANPSHSTYSLADSIGNSLSSDYDIHEDVTAGYAMANLVFGKLTVIPGVRVEHTSGTYRGKIVTDTSTLDQGFNAETKKSYTDAFPGINLRYNATDRLVVRAGATTAIGRPNYEQLAPFVLVEDGGDTVTLGNPDLKPLRSKNADLSIEYYLPHGGLLSVAGFYKHIDDPIFDSHRIGAGSYRGISITGANVDQPINGSSSEVYGVEINLQAPLTFLPSPFDGFGVNLNYTRTGGWSRVPGRADKVDNYLQSRDVASAQLYYEKDKLALRVAYSYRSHQLDTVGAGPASDEYTDSNGQLDARISFALMPQAIVFVEGSNLTDAPWRRYFGVRSQLIENEHYSYTVRGGVQLAF